MGSGAITIVLIFLLLFVSWQTIYAANRDLARAKAWGDLARKALPFLALLLMVLSLFLVQSFGQGQMLLAWMAVSAVAIIGASFLSTSSLERNANRAFRAGDYARAVELYKELVEEKPLARNKAFLGAALGASERYEESVEASTQAIEDDPEYGLAYYNRALVLQRMGKKSRAVKDLEKAQETDLPRRFRSASRRMLEELSVKLLYPTLGALVILMVFTFLIGRQNRDLLRVRAYRDFFLRLIPPLSTGVFVAGLPFVMNLATVENYGPVLLVYLGGAAVLTALMTRAVTPDERRAGTAFRKGEYEKAANLYDEICARRPLPRYYSALGASLDASGNPGAALEATDQAIKLDPRLGIAHYNRASALAALGEKARARGDLQKVFQVDSSRSLRRAAAEALESLEKS